MGKDNTIGKVVGAAVVGIAAGAAAMALKDNDSRKKLGKTVQDLTRKAQKMTMDAQKDPNVKEAVKKAKPIVKKAKGETRKALK